MSQECTSNRNAMLLALLGAATLGAILMALTTPKTGREVRNTLRSAGNRLRGKVEETDDSDDDMTQALFI